MWHRDFWDQIQDIQGAMMVDLWTLKDSEMDLRNQQAVWDKNRCHLVIENSELENPL